MDRKKETAGKGEQNVRKQVKKVKGQLRSRESYWHYSGGNLGKGNLALPSPPPLAHSALCHGWQHSEPLPPRRGCHDQARGEGVGRLGGLGATHMYCETGALEMGGAERRRLPRLPQLEQ